MSNVIIDLKNIDITFTQKRRTIQAVKSRLKKVIFTESLAIQGLVNLLLFVRSIFYKYLQLVKSLSVKM